MGFFDIFKSATPEDLAKKLFENATNVNVLSEEKNILNASSIDINAYIKERKLMQTSHTMGLVSYAAHSRNNVFFKNTANKLSRHIKIYYESNKYFNHEDAYKLEDYLRSYYSFDTPKHMLDMVFHALRQQTIIIKNADYRNIFENSFNQFFSESSNILRPYMKKEGIQ